MASWVKALSILLIASVSFASASGFTLNEDILVRYGYTLAAYQAMSSSEQRRVEEFIESMEAQRRAAPKPGRKAPAKPKVSPAELESLKTVNPAALFDNSGGGPSPWEVSATLQETDFRKFSLHNKPYDFGVEFGDLGAGGVNPLWGQSLYLNLTKGHEGSGSVFDYGWHGQAALVRAQSRLYSSDNPGLDSRVDSAINNLNALSPGALTNPTYSSGFQESNLFVGSLLGHLGRAYRVIGPFDFSYSAMGLMKVTGIFPNATTDQSAGVRAKLGDNNVGIFGGVTEAVGLFTKTVVQDSIPSGSIAVDPHVDLAPHASVAAWGKVPYLSKVEYNAEAGRQWNPWTTVQSAALSVTAPVGDGRAGLHGSVSREAGDIEYSRDKASVGVSYSPKPGVDLSADYARDNASLGNAAMNRDSVMVSLRVTGSDPGKPDTTFTELLGGQDRFIIPDTQAPLFIRMMGFELGILQGLKDAADSQIPGGTAAAWQQVQAAYNALTPGQRQMLGDAWKIYLPSAPPLSQILSFNPFADLDKVIAVAGLLSDPAVLDRILVRAMRRQILANLDKVEIPILGQNFKMTAPLVLAAAHAYATGLVPMPAVTETDARLALDPQFYSQLSSQLGCPGSGAQALSNCLLAKLPPAEQAFLKKTYGADLAALITQAVSWSSDIIRREMNSLLLQVMIAAGRFDELNVDRGRKISDINVSAVKNQFALLDARGRKSRKVIVESAEAMVSKEMTEQDAAIRKKLTDYGQKRLAWLEGQQAWPRAVQVAVKASDWPALLATYGDAGLFRLILEAKAKGSGRFYFQMNDNPLLDGLDVRPGDPTVVALPRTPPKSRPLELRL